MNRLFLKLSFDKWLHERRVDFYRNGYTKTDAAFDAFIAGYQQAKSEENYKFTRECHEKLH